MINSGPQYVYTIYAYYIYSTWDNGTVKASVSDMFSLFLSALTDSEEDHSCVCEALRCVKELITAVDSKVNEQEKKQRLREVYRYTTLTSSGQ